MALDQHWLVTVGLVTSSLIAVTANLLLLLVFCRRRGLRTVSNRFVINLLFTNLLSSTFLIPLLLVDQEINAGASLSNITEKAINISSLHFHIENVDFRTDNISRTRKIILQEENEKEIIEEKDIFRQTDKLIFNDSDKKRDNQSDNLELVEENITTQTIITETALQNASVQKLRKILCYVAQTSTSLICTASILSILLIAVDQYFAVIHSLRYHSYINKCRSMVLIVSSWLFAIVFGIFGAVTENESNFWRFCFTHPSVTKETSTNLKTLNSVYAFTYLIFVIISPFVAICVIYICIYTAARQNSERMRKSTTGNGNSVTDSYTQIPIQSVKAPSENELNLKVELNSKTSAITTKTIPKVQSAPNFTLFEPNAIAKQVTSPVVQSVPTVARANLTRTPSERCRFIATLKYKISNASLFKYREETRAAKISLLVIFMVFVCYVPYGVAVILNSSFFSYQTPRVFNFVALILLVTSNIISPFVFAYRNRRIQREFVRFFRSSQNKHAKEFNSAREASRKNSLKNHFVALHKTAGNEVNELKEIQALAEPFLCPQSIIPKVIVSCKTENERNEKKSILKRVCSSKNWPNYKKCSFITVPESCLGTDSARGSFSSASTQMSSEE